VDIKCRFISVITSHIFCWRKSSEKTKLKHLRFALGFYRGARKPLEILVISQKYESIQFFLYFLLVYSQIWLKLPTEDHHICCIILWMIATLALSQNSWNKHWCPCTFWLIVRYKKGTKTCKKVEELYPASSIRRDDIIPVLNKQNKKMVSVCGKCKNL
jgi:hypothetical protein